MRDIRDMEAFAVSQNAIEEIYAERRRQVDGEGWTPEHDDEHVAGTLSKAASLYAMAAIRGDNDRRWRSNGFPPPTWPWEARWWKPGPPRRMLIKAAALIIAEIERLDRLAAKATGASS